MTTMSRVLLLISQHPQASYLLARVSNLHQYKELHTSHISCRPLALIIHVLLHRFPASIEW